MIKQIKTYKDLLDEKARLEALFREQKVTIRNDIRNIGEEFRPVTNAASFLGKMVTREGGNFFLNASTNKLIDIVFKKLLLARTGWITKLVVPFLMKNYSSHIISENKATIWSKLLSFIGKKHANGQEKVHEE
jgi:hypothetical protein